MKRLVLLLVLLAALPSSACAKTPARVASARPRILTLAPPGEEWAGVYISDRKIGSLVTDLTEETRNGRKVIVFKSAMTFKMSVGDQSMNRDSATERVYEYKDGGRLLSFTVSNHGDGGDEVLTGTCTPRGIDALRKRPGRPDEKVHFSATKETIDVALAEQWVASTGQSLSGSVFDLEQSFTDEALTTELAGRETRLLAGVPTRVVLLKTTHAKLAVPIITLVTEDGHLIESRVGPMLLRGEPKEVAQKLDHVDRIDFMSTSRIVLSSAIPPEALEVPGTGRFVLTGLPKAMQRSSGRQLVVPMEQEKALMTVTAHAPTHRNLLPIAPSTPELAEALKATPTVESDAEPIKTLARQIVGQTKDAWTAAQLLNTYVFKTLGKTYSVSSDRATDVLRLGKGDCTEHSLLLTALARSVGIPARRVDGVVYMLNPGDVPAFYWHEWVEVYVGEWISIDPALGQSIADVSHLAFGGEGNMNAALVMGQLQIAYEPK